MHIVIGTDLSDGSTAGARWAFDFPRHTADQVDRTVVHAMEARYPQILDTEVRLEDRSNRDKLEEAVADWTREALGDGGGEFTTELREGRPEDVLRAAVDEHEAEWLAVGMTGRGALARMVVGSTAERLAHGPPTNFAICHPDTAVPSDNPSFAVGVDFTDASARAVRLGASMARAYDGELRIVHVVEPPSVEAYPFDAFEETAVENIHDLVDRMEDELEFFISELEDDLAGVDWRTDTITGYPTREMVDYAEEESLDGLVLGTAGRTAMGDFLMGSVSRGVVKHMNCSVYLAPPVG
jgi:nucleotide-binding universal stress UspA family protein